MAIDLKFQCRRLCSVFLPFVFFSSVLADHNLYDYSYANLTLYSAATPQFDDEQQEEWDASKDANNPDNFNDEDDTEEEEVFVKEY